MPAPELLNVPPEDAIRHFRAKGYHVGHHWRDTSAAEHLRSFTAAKVTKLDILEDIRAAVDQALAGGATFETFQKELEPILRRKGWWGRQQMIDPLTGKLETVQLGSARRLKIIYDTNLRMAHAHGRWQAIERLAKQRPYLRYVSVRDARTRPEHARWHGTVLPWDHPFWRTHYPPNGWRCRCIVQQLSERDLKRYGHKVSSGPPPGSNETRPWFDKRNRTIIQVPRGIDPGFGHNVGRIDLDKAASNRLVRRIDQAPGDLARAAIGTPWNTPLFKQHLTGARNADWPVAILTPGILKALGGRSKTVRLSGETAAKQTVRHREYTPEDYARVQRILDEGEVFMEDNGRFVDGFLEQGGQIWKAVVKRTANGSETYLMTLHRAQDYDRRAARKRYKPIND